MRLLKVAPEPMFVAATHSETGRNRIPEINVVNHLSQGTIFEYRGIEANNQLYIKKIDKMGKSQDAKKEAKKKPAKTEKEKRAAKQEKKKGRD